MNQCRNYVKYIYDFPATSYIIFNTILKVTHSSIENTTIRELVVISIEYEIPLLADKR